MSIMVLFDDATISLLLPTVERMKELERQYGAGVYEPLGLPVDPRPGRYTTSVGAPAFVIDFSQIEQQFRNLTEEVFGTSLPLLRINTGESVGGPLYNVFRQFWRTQRLEEEWTRAIG